MGNEHLNIQWYPGHMEKARRDMQDALKQVDMVIEIRDARIPNASRNPMLDKMIGDKPRLIVLSKSDLADDAASEAWVKALSKEGQKAVYGDLVGQKRNRQMIINECLELTKICLKKQLQFFGFVLYCVQLVLWFLGVGESPLFLLIIFKLLKIGVL